MFYSWKTEFPRDWAESDILTSIPVLFPAHHAPQFILEHTAFWLKAQSPFTLLTMPDACPRKRDHIWEGAQEFQTIQRLPQAQSSPISP